MSEVKKTETIRKKLSEPMPYKWRVHSKSKDGKKALFLAYIDARDVMDRLDSVLGIDQWQCRYKSVDGKVYCGIGILFDNNGWVWKWDAGDETKVEEVKGEASDSFKRAGVRWGIGRFLYNEDMEWILINSFGKPIQKDGKEIEDVHEYILRRREYFKNKNG